MQSVLAALRPSTVRWLPHDLPQPDSQPSSSKAKDKVKSKPKRRTLLSFSKISSEPYHGAPKRRKSVLSLTDAPDEEWDARTNMQGHSLFFARIPIEVRKIVYEYVMGSETVHLTLGTKKRSGHFICPESNADDVESNYEEPRDCNCKILVGGAGQSGRLSNACLHLLTVCRRIYHEAIPHLYTPHTFSILHPTHLLYLPVRLPTPRLVTLRTLHLRMPIRALPYFCRVRDPSRLAYPEDTANWEKTWRILAGMAGLQDLHVVLLDKSVDGIWEALWLGLQEKLLEGPMGVVRPRRFVLVLPYKSCRVDWDMGESRCVLRRPQGGEEEAEEEE